MKAWGIKDLIKEIKSEANPVQAINLQRFFKTDPGQYGAGDVFLGLKVPVQREIAARYTHLKPVNIQTLLNSPYHEFRLIGLLILTKQYQTVDPVAQKSLVRFYLKNSTRINNWDLVDLSVYKILGDYLWQEIKAGRYLETKKTLDKLAGSNNLWQRRMAMIATLAFIKQGDFRETLRLAQKLLKDSHDLMHKAVGWTLREVGKKAGERTLLNFLDKYSRQMPRTALRYALEKLSPKQRAAYLKK